MAVSAVQWCMFAADDHLLRSMSVHPIFGKIDEWFDTLLEIKAVTETEMYHCMVIQRCMMGNEGQKISRFGGA